MGGSRPQRPGTSHRTNGSLVLRLDATVPGASEVRCRRFPLGYGKRGTARPVRARHAPAVLRSGGITMDVRAFVPVLAMGLAIWFAFDAFGFFESSLGYPGVARWTLFVLVIGVALWACRAPAEETSRDD